MPNLKWYTIFETQAQAHQALPQGQMRRLRLGALRICLAHTPQGFRAVQDECPHKRASLSTGRLGPNGSVVCPLHFYCYSLFDGQEVSQKTRPVTVYPIKWHDGKLQIGLIPAQAQ